MQTDLYRVIVKSEYDTDIIDRAFLDYAEALQFYQELEDFTWDSRQSRVLLKETWERICTVPCKREYY
jgi:hypothetical protein